MFNVYNNKFQNISKLKKKWKRYLQSVLSEGEKLGHKGKPQIEIAKLKWELKQKYNELGKYVAEKKISKSATDYSYDQHFLKLVNEVNGIRLYIEERQQKRDSRKSNLVGENKI